MKTTRRIYWDACVFIHALEQTVEYRPTLEAIVDEARAGRLVIVTSALTLAETGVRVAQDGAPTDELLDVLFRSNYISVRALDAPLASQARRIARAHGLKPMDAIHVATAIDCAVEVMHTMDGKTKRRGLIPKSGKIGEPGLVIKEPDWPVQNRLALDEPADNH